MDTSRPIGFVRIPFVLLVAVALLSCDTQGAKKSDDGEGDGPPSDAIPVMVDGEARRQVIEGFGATHKSLVFGGKDNLTPALRERALEAVYGQVELTTGNLEVGGYELNNDNEDPSTFAWDAFDWKRSDWMVEKLVRPAEPMGFDNYYPALAINLRWEMSWMKDLRETDYERYLAEAAEHVVAGLLYWENTYDIVPRYVLPFAEPTTGNQTLDGGRGRRELADLVEAIGKRMRAEGFEDVKMVVPGEASEGASLKSARTILERPEARQYVGAIAYHSYPYGSVYSSVKRILETSGQGVPNPEKIEVRNQLRELGKQYGLPVWMTEISMGPGRFDFEFGAMENVRARAIHIHDEFVYTGASAFFGMNNMWDLKAHRDHFNGSDNFLSEQSTIALINNETGAVHTSGMGYAIGHYARWINRGAVRLEATSADSLLQVTAFRDDTQNRFVLVAINNSPAEKSLDVQLSNLRIQGEVTGEQSAKEKRWEPVSSFEPSSPQRIIFSVPGRSVTTIAVPLDS